jgi:uncharacterized protein
VTDTPLAQAESLHIGTVEFIAPDEARAVLDTEAPDSVALNAGVVRAFPRVNGYVLMPVEDGHLVGQIEWLTVERAPLPKRRGVQDSGLVDLPHPVRKMRLNPLGTLRKQPGPQERYVFRRGTGALPSVGTPVLLPTETQLRCIVESSDRGRVRIGTSPLAGNAEVRVDPDRLFGRHLAVLGNTGSGKSCSVAGIIRWSLESVEAELEGKGARPNARFVVLDPNGEYSSAFGGGASALNARVFRVSPAAGDLALKVPLWFWNSAEWSCFTQASAKTQRPTLIQALRFVREGDTEPAEDPSRDTRRFLRTIVATLRTERNTGSPWGAFPKPKSFFEKLEKWKAGLETELPSCEGDAKAKLEALVAELDALCVARRVKFPHYDFTKPEIDSLLEVASIAHSALGGAEADILPADVDAPRPFAGESLLRGVEAAAEMLNVSEHVETLLIRIRALLTDVRMKPILGGASDISLEQWLGDYIGTDGSTGGCLSVIDLSLVPTDVVHVLTAVIARMVFEALQRYVKLNGVALPTVLVMEEAHTFIKRYREESEFHDAAAVCCQVFERIAREGRKFGLGLVLSSQRPSELSPTVLSQCNSFLLHRISNDADQELVHRLVPDNLKGLLRELPSLPSQSAIILGWASELPVLVKMKDLPPAQRPRSRDPDFWDVWTGTDREGLAVDRKADWRPIAEDWQGQK